MTDSADHPAQERLPLAPTSADVWAFVAGYASACDVSRALLDRLRPPHVGAPQGGASAAMPLIHELGAQLLEHERNPRPLETAPLAHTERGQRLQAHLRSALRIAQEMGRS